MAGDYELRRIGGRDLGRLAEADPRLADPARAAHIGALLAADLSWAAFDAAGALVAFAVVTRHFFGFPFIELLVTSQAARRRGIGSALMARCESAHDADRIFTSTNESNAPMRALLSRRLASGRRGPLPRPGRSGAVVRETQGLRVIAESSRP
jgi:GNAT superfamily N-acetyltransferase